MDSSPDSRMLVSLTVDELVQIIRQEVSAAQADKSEKLLLSTKEAAAKLGVEESWLASRARAGLVPCRMLGHYRYFSMSDSEMIIDTSGVPMVQSDHDGKGASTDSKVPRVKSIPTRGDDGNDGD